jgi:mRNA interferase HigB
MHVISRRTLREFWEKHPPAKAPLAAWFRILETSEFPDFANLKRAFSAADYFAPYTIFNVGGNKYRVIAVVHYRGQRAYIRHVFTHPEYDEWSYDVRRTNRSKR